MQANPNPNHTACPRVSLQLTAGLADRRNTLKILSSGTESILALAHSPMPVESDEDDEAEAVQAALRVERKAVANAAAAARHVELNARREAGRAAQLAKAAAKRARRGLPCD